LGRSEKCVFCDALLLQRTVLFGTNKKHRNELVADGYRGTRGTRSPMMRHVFIGVVSMSL
jgi:hypothetical protein